MFVDQENSILNILKKKFWYMYIGMTHVLNLHENMHAVLGSREANYAWTWIALGFLNKY